MLVQTKVTAELGRPLVCYIFTVNTELVNIFSSLNPFLILFSRIVW